MLISIIGKRQNFQQDQKTGQNLKQNNKTIALNVLYVQYNTKTISVAYRSEYNSKRKKASNFINDYQR